LDKFDVNLTVRDGIISLGNLNSKHVRHSLTMSLFYAPAKVRRH